MKVNIYYGGRGLVDDPTKLVLEKMQAVFDELRVTTERYNLFELKNSITTLPQTMKDADGIILATTIEWLGIGGYMQQFLDACWLYGDKAKMRSLYMFPVVMSQTYGEREGVYMLQRAWDMIGGKTCEGLSAYVSDTLEFELNTEYMEVVEKKAEDIYRVISKKTKTLPTSTNEITQAVMKDNLDLTPQESEQLSKYVSNDEYVKKQKEDIEELSTLFMSMMATSDETSEGLTDYIAVLKNRAKPVEDLNAEYMIHISDTDECIHIRADEEEVTIDNEPCEDADVTGKLTSEVLKQIIAGEQTFQKAFMSGEMSAKGNFKTLRMLDQMFGF
ncbi:MAG: SCP2 sterol-binding domain-containing protein [Lachnospiraceae bacterium]|uniref:SCP2 sterol-binding domain-containing protein n=1 Tax=Falcatimonas sp. MSJ-15 TaxID=2841515 RepID=UPI001C0FC93A|nr:SCP2 sterol-binding domain-containing protein [Falcatimonas sp. MSJ-15]MBQ5734550.1 SCP2 sterol-binding domain-containing protein [Lachnospiraceae bacterium]MBU5470923.1 SCP2 sterol-binding domain-containing protein [Falcatimonas sp. MSJ-15]